MVKRLLYNISTYYPGDLWKTLRTPLKDLSNDSRYTNCGFDLGEYLYYEVLRYDVVWYVNSSVSEEPTASIFMVKIIFNSR